MLTEKIQVLWNVAPYHIQGQYHLDPEDQGITIFALRYKPAGREFDSRWCHWNFLGT